MKITSREAAHGAISMIAGAHSAPHTCQVLQANQSEKCIRPENTEMIACRGCIWCLKDLRPSNARSEVFLTHLPQLVSGHNRERTALFRMLTHHRPQTLLSFNIYPYESVPEKSTFLPELHIGHNLSNREPGILSAFNHWKKYLSKSWFKKKK